MFGALEKCPLCEGHMEYQGGSYRCRGFLSAWSKCTFITQTPKRITEKWKIGEDSDNAYLLEVMAPFIRFLVVSMYCRENTRNRLHL